MDRICFGLCAVLSFSLMAGTDFEPKNRPYDVETYQISMDLDPRANPSGFSATVRTRLKLTRQTDTLDFDAVNLKIHSVHFVQPRRIEARYKLDNNTLRVVFPQSLKAGGVEIEISYDGVIASDHHGFFKVTDPDDADRGPLYFTHFEPLGARSFFPCNDEPYDKALTSVDVAVPKGFQVISNGELLAVQTIRKSQQSWQRFRWQMKRPHSTYLMSLAIGKFEKVSEKRKAGAAISVWVGEKRKARAGYCLEITQRAMEFFEGYLGVGYPWGKYDTVGLPTYLWGGMENTSVTHMNEERTVLNDTDSSTERRRIVSLAAHELAHQWFGDMVTMQWWDDLWLNEAFASYFGTLATQHILGTDEEMIQVVTDTWDEYFREEDGPRSHPIVDKSMPSVDDAFDATNYTKGEAVLRMLSALLGEPQFKQAVTAYLKEFSFGNATYQDFFKTVQRVSGIDVSGFRDSWLLQKGYPVVRFEGKWDAKRSRYRLNLSQTPNQGEKGSRPFVLPLTVAFHRKSEPVFTQKRSVVMSQAEETVEIELPAKPEWVSVNERGAALVGLRQSRRDEAVLILQAEGDPDALSRVWALYELGDGLLNGKGLSRRAEAQLLRSLQRDSSPYVRIALLNFFKRSKSRWLPDRLGSGIIELVKEYSSARFEDTPLYQSDPHGWRLVRAQLVGALGRVRAQVVLPLAAQLLANAKLPLDDLFEAAYAVAAQGLAESLPMLEVALERHGGRGYRYRFGIQYAYGSVENAAAAQAIAELSKTATTDLMGRIGWAVKDNQTLKNSKEWAAFLADFILNDKRFGDDVKARILQTLDEVTQPFAKELLVRLVKETPSERIRELSERTLRKNFGR